MSAGLERELRARSGVSPTGPPKIDNMSGNVVCITNLVITECQPCHSTLDRGKKNCGEEPLTGSANNT